MTWVVLCLAADALDEELHTQRGAPARVREHVPCVETTISSLTEL